MIIILYLNNAHFILILILVKIIYNINHNNIHNHKIIILVIIVIVSVSKIAMYYKNNKIIPNKIRMIIVIIVDLKINIIRLMKLKILINRYLGCIKLVEYVNNQITTIIIITMINNIHIDQIVVYYPHHKISQIIKKQNIHNINNKYHHYHNPLFYI